MCMDYVGLGRWFAIPTKNSSSFHSRGTRGSNPARSFDNTLGWPLLNVLCSSYLAAATTLLLLLSPPTCPYSLRSDHRPRAGLCELLPRPQPSSRRCLHPCSTRSPDRSWVKSSPPSIWGIWTGHATRRPGHPHNPNNSYSSPLRS